MTSINSFDKKDRANSTFIDRLGVFVLFVLFAGFAILLPVIIYKWYVKSKTLGRVIIWVALGCMFMLGMWLDQS